MFTQNANINLYHVIIFSFVFVVVYCSLLLYENKQLSSCYFSVSICLFPSSKTVNSILTFAVCWLDIHNSSDDAQPHSLIVNYVSPAS